MKPPAGESRAILELSAVSKAFGSLTAVDRIDLEIMEGEFFTIVGPSGSGKTTLVRILAGMESATAGNIWLRGKRINDIPANRRPTCMVFQSLALFPHRSVGDNIEFALKIRGIDKPTRKARALELMRQLRLPETYYGRSVQKCSGGERQRVALARALAFNPEILFFDEPLSAIDYKLRKTLEKELKDIHRETGKTFVYITHSLEEAMVMSDRIGVMREGKLVQVGTPNQIYTAPETKFVSEFMGDVNIVRVNVGADGRLSAAEFEATFRGPRPANGMTAGHLVIRGRRDGSRLVLEVEDDGPGLPREFRLASSSGVGLGATAARLALLHPGKHQLELSNLAGGGCRAMVTLPFRAA